MGKPYVRMSERERRALVAQLAHEGRELSRRVPGFTRAVLEMSLAAEFPDQRPLIRTLMAELFATER